MEVLGKPSRDGARSRPDIVDSADFLGDTMLEIRSDQMLDLLPGRSFDAEEGGCFSDHRESVSQFLGWVLG